MISEKSNELKKCGEKGFEKCSTTAGSSYLNLIGVVEATLLFALGLKKSVSPAIERLLSPFLYHVWR